MEVQGNKENIMKVTLLNPNRNKEKEWIVAKSASQCYDTKLDSIEEAERLIDNVLNSGHDSILEHVTFSFEMEGVSRALTNQLIRHRMVSPTQQSQRYCRLDNSIKWYIVPKSVKIIEEALDIYEDTMYYIANSYYKLIGMGIKEEDARYLLPNGTETKLVITANARALKNFFKQRCCTRSQLEIRELANEMLRLAKEDCPIIFKNAGATCEKGYCFEAKPCKPNVMKLEG